MFLFDSTSATPSTLPDRRASGAARPHGLSVQAQSVAVTTRRSAATPVLPILDQSSQGEVIKFMKCPLPKSCCPVPRRAQTCERGGGLCMNLRKALFTALIALTSATLAPAFSVQVNFGRKSSLSTCSMSTIRVGFVGTVRSLIAPGSSRAGGPAAKDGPTAETAPRRRHTEPDAASESESRFDSSALTFPRGTFFAGYHFRGGSDRPLPRECR